MLRQPEPAHLSPYGSLEPVVVFQASDGTKAAYPWVYVIWDACLQDANALVMAGDEAESRRFRGTLVRSFLLHMVWPGLLSAAFVLVLVYYPLYMIWFAWIGFVLFIFALYRVKEFCDTYYYLSRPVACVHPSPNYYENYALPLPPPPTYSVAQGSPPAYLAAMAQVPRTTSYC